MGLFINVFKKQRRSEENQSATLMINRWVECFWRPRCYLVGLCALPLAIFRLANMFRLTSALLLQLWALAAFGQDFFVSTNAEYERLQLVWSAVFTAECLNSWLPLNVWQVISEAEDTGGKTHSLVLESTLGNLVCNDLMSLHFLFLSIQNMIIITITSLKSLQ